MRKAIWSTLLLSTLLSANIFAQSLDDFISLGVKNSPLLYDLNNQRIASKFDSLLILATFKPQIRQLTQFAHYPTCSGWGYDEAITNGGNYSAVVNYNQPILNKKLISGRLYSLELINQTLKVNEKITTIELTKGITAQYLTAYTVFAQNMFYKSVVETLNSEEKTLKILVEKGVYAITDLMNLQVMISSQKIILSQSSIQLSNDIALLFYICGISEMSNVNLLKPDLKVNEAYNPEKSPLFTQFKIDSLKNINNKQLIDNNYRPRLNLFADAGFNAIKAENIPHNLGTSLGINLSIPIYDGKQRKLEFNKINLSENSRLFYKKIYSSQYKLQFDQLNNQLKQSDNLIIEIKNQIDELEKLIGIYHLELDKGLVRFLDFITVFNNYIATKNSAMVADMGRMQIINQMNHLK